MKSCAAANAAGSCTQGDNVRFLPFGFILTGLNFSWDFSWAFLSLASQNVLPSLKGFPETPTPVQCRPAAELSTEINPYRDQLTAYLDHLHAAAPLFDLREILIPPRILLPPPIADPDRRKMLPPAYWLSCPPWQIGTRCLLFFMLPPFHLENWSVKMLISSLPGSRDRAVQPRWLTLHIIYLLHPRKPARTSRHFLSLSMLPILTFSSL